MVDEAAILLVSESMKVVSDREIDEPDFDRLANLACCAREACGLVAQAADGGAEGGRGYGDLQSSCSPQAF